MGIKEDAHRIIDELPESDMPKVLRHLRLLRAAKDDPFVQTVMDAPLDDEPTTAEEDAGAAEARGEIKRGEGKPLKDVRAVLLRG